MPIPKRGLTNIRTLAGRADQIRVPYRGYMQISCLEMEKQRRGTERRNALARVATIDARLLRIEQEKAELLASLGDPRELTSGPTHKRQRLAGQSAESRPADGTFKIRY